MHKLSDIAHKGKNVAKAFFASTMIVMASGCVLYHTLVPKNITLNLSSKIHDKAVVVSHDSLTITFRLDKVQPAASAQLVMSFKLLLKSRESVHLTINSCDITIEACDRKWIPESIYCSRIKKENGYEFEAGQSGTFELVFVPSMHCARVSNSFTIDLSGLQIEMRKDTLKFGSYTFEEQK